MRARTPRMSCTPPVATATARSRRAAARRVATSGASVGATASTAALAGTFVGDDDAHERPVATRREPQRAALGARRDRVAHGVLDERLEQQARHLGVIEPGLDRLLDPEPRAEARALDRQVFAQERHLVG